ncbi:MAG: carbon-nitrogen family hydrolase [Pseudomonadota bacterium]
MISVSAGVIQTDVQLGNVSANLKQTKRHIQSLARKKVKIMVLPELWSTGFSYANINQLSNTTPEILDHISNMARQFNAIIIGSLPEKIHDKIFNTAYVIDENGQIAATYQKIHLFSPTQEDRHFGRGEKSVVCNTSAGPIGLLICYDLRFPELCRSLALQGAKIIVVCAQWPEARLIHWQTLLRARAIENQAFILASNRCGQDQTVAYAGRSQIISPFGDILASAGKRPAGIISTLDFNVLNKFRETIPCFADRIVEAYGS